MNAAGIKTAADAVEHEDCKSKYLLASMRVGSLNLRSWAAEIDGIGIALRGGMITTDTAIEHLDYMGVLRWLPDDRGAP